MSQLVLQTIILAAVVSLNTHLFSFWHWPWRNCLLRVLGFRYRYSLHSKLTMAFRGLRNAHLRGKSFFKHCGLFKFTLLVLLLVIIFLQLNQSRRETNAIIRVKVVNARNSTQSCFTHFALFLYVPCVAVRHRIPKHIHVLCSLQRISRAKMLIYTVLPRADGF